LSNTRRENLKTYITDFIITVMTLIKIFQMTWQRIRRGC